MSKAKTYEQKIARLKEVIREQDTQIKRLNHRLATMATERDALRRLVNHDK